MYKLDSYKEPFWAENSGFITGRDPLGIQNSSITTYARLLPGMTNLTLRLRYYGFYMWIIREFYKKHEGSTDFTHREHYNFIRRGELILAFLMERNAPNEKSIIGSDFTGNHLDEVDNKGYFDIHLGADKLKDTVKGSVYWDFRSGALGQYYAGALSNLELINTDGQFFQLEKRGEELANAFSESINETAQRKFLEIIESGRLTEDDIQQLDTFRINNISPLSSEWEFYIEMLSNKDGDGFQDSQGVSTFMRKETIKLLLDYYKQQGYTNDDRAFILHQFNLNNQSLSSGASFGWYYYYLNEAFHIAAEGVFWSLLVELDGRPKEVEGFIDNLVNPVLIIAENELNIKASKNLLDVILSVENKAIPELLNDIHQLHKKIDNTSVVLLRSLELMMSIYRLINDLQNQILDFEKKYKIILQKGRVSENMKVFIDDAIEYDFGFFIRNTVRKIMNDHVNTAYRKMGNGESNLLKFMIEDGIISHIQTMAPRHTSPRLRAVSNFLHDLSLIDSKNKLTNHGISLLNNWSS